MSKKIIISVLACNTPHYERMEAAARDTCFKDPPENISIYYVHNYRDGVAIQEGESKLIDDCFYYGEPASRATLLRKCIEFWGYCLKNFDFDYIFRPNLGCWVSMDVLDKIVQQLPDKKVYAGVRGRSKGGIPFISGSGFVLSRDLVELIWEYYKNPENKPFGIECDGRILIDDVSIGAFLAAFDLRGYDREIRWIDLPRKDLKKHQISSEAISFDCHHYYYLSKDPECYYKMQEAIDTYNSLNNVCSWSYEFSIKNNTYSKYSIKNKDTAKNPKDKRLKILAVLVNFGKDQIEYLQRVVSELKSFSKYNVTIVLQTNLPIEEVNGVDITNVIRMRNYQILPLTCRKVIQDECDNYDYFIYSENDHLWKESHVDKMIEYEKILPEDRIAGLIQFETNEQGERFYPALHKNFGWSRGSVEEYKGLSFAHFSNIHQASFFLSRKQLSRILSEKDFTNFMTSDYSEKCKTNTDIYNYKDCGMHKLICISEFEDSLIQHLPGVYCLEVKGRSFYKNSTASERSMQDQLCRLEFGGMGISKLMYDKILELIPNGSNILELGSGDVSTRLLSRHYNMFSIENNIDFIGKYQSKYIHAPLASGWYDINAIKDKLPKHYELLLIDGPRGSRKTTVEDIQRSFNIDKCVIIVDDTNRSENKRLFTGLSNLFPHRQSEIISCHEKSFGIIYFQ